jgi:adenylate cyclase
VLGRVPGLKVVGSASAFSFKGKSVPIAEIARQLGVTHLVEGAVLQEGQTVRITAKLIQADGFQVWVSDKLDRELKNIFALHDEVAGLIAKNLSLKLGASSAASKAPVNPEAFELYLQARQAWNLRTPAGFDLAENLLTRALDLEPKFARAHAALADVWAQRLFRQRDAIGTDAQPNPTDSARIREKITQVLALDPDSAEAYAALGMVLCRDGQNAGAESSLRRAVALNPSYASAQQWLGQVLVNHAQMDEALRHKKIATELAPLSPITWAAYGFGLVHAGQTTAGLAACDSALALQPNFEAALRVKCTALVELGRFDDAVAAGRRLPSASALNADILLFVFARAGMNAAADELLRELNSKGSISRERPRSLLALGRTEEVFTHLARTGFNLYRAADYLWDPTFDPVRNDPRWVKLIADAGLTEAHSRAQAWRKAHPPERPAK